jgi:O-succinylbenzoate synthase
MILTGFDLFRYRLPLAMPLTLRGTVLDARDGLVVRLTSSTGAVGWGEVSPLPGFSRESLHEAQQQVLAQRAALLGWAIMADWISLEGAFIHHLDAQGLKPSVRFGVELALWNLQAAARRTTLAHLLTSRPRAAVSLNGLLMGPAEEVLANAQRMREAGYRAVKLKVGRGAIEEEIDLVRAVSRVLGPGVRLRLDANRAWSLDEASAFIRGITGVGIAYIEEPLKDPALLPDLVARYAAPVALDETLLDVSVEALGRHDYAHAVILKPTLLGGLVPTLRLARRATALGMTPVLSATFETGVGLLGLVALAASVTPDDVPAGLDTYRWLAVDLLAPRLDLDRPQVEVEVLLGASRTIQESLLQHVA